MCVCVCVCVCVGVGVCANTQNAFGNSPLKLPGHCSKIEAEHHPCAGLRARPAKARRTL